MFRSILIAAFSLLVVATTYAQPAVTTFNQGIKQKDDKKYAEALSSFKKAVSLNPKYKEALYWAGWCCNELSNYTDAVKYLQQAKALWPNEAKVYFELGYASEKLEKTEEAKINYKKCIELYSDYALAYEALGNLYYDEKDYSKALEYYTSYTEKEDGISSSDFYYRKGFCENDTEKYNDAIQSLKKSIELDGENNFAYTELGYSNYALENYDEALTQLKKAIAINKSALPIYYSGLCYVALKQKTDALKIYDDLSEMKSDYAAKLKKKIDEL
jgi:tetratricopeptide (TPR) repeat protein